MEFSEKELKLIAAAKKKSSDSYLKRVLMLVAILVGLGLMFAGVVDPDHFAYMAAAAVLLSVGMPQFGDGPKYEDLVRLLESKSRNRE